MYKYSNTLYKVCSSYNKVERLFHYWLGAGYIGININSDGSYKGDINRSNYNFRSLSFPRKHGYHFVLRSVWPICIGFNNMLLMLILIAYLNTENYVGLLFGLFFNLILVISVWLGGVNFFIMLNLIIICLILIGLYVNFYHLWDFEKVESLFPFGANGCINNYKVKNLSFTLVCDLPNGSFHQLEVYNLNSEEVLASYYYIYPIEDLLCIICFLVLMALSGGCNSTTFYPIQVLSKLITLSMLLLSIPILLFFIHYIVYFILWQCGGSDCIGNLITLYYHDILWRHEYEYIFIGCIMIGSSRFKINYKGLPFIFRYNIRLLLFLVLLFIYYFIFYIRDVLFTF